MRINFLERGRIVKKKSHVEEQLVVAIGPMQHKIAVTSTKRSVIQYRNYMEKTRKQDKHKDA